MAQKKIAKKIKSKEIVKQKNNRKTVYIAVAIVVIILLAILLVVQTVSNNRIKDGSAVTVDYTLYLEDGTVFDTTIEEIGISSNLQNPDYTPLVFTIGDKKIISGFQEEILGLRKGDEKSFTLTPERAYGDRRDDMVREFSRETNMTRYAYLDINKYKNALGDPVVGSIVNIPTILWDFKITEVDDTNVILENVLKEGDVIRLNGFGWETLVLSVGEEFIYIRHNPSVGDYISSEINPRFAVITDVSEDLFTADANFELAGKTIRFDVKITDVQNQSQ